MWVVGAELRSSVREVSVRLGRVILPAPLDIITNVICFDTIKPQTPLNYFWWQALFCRWGRQTSEKLSNTAQGYKARKWQSQVFKWSLLGSVVPDLDFHACTCLTCYNRFIKWHCLVKIRLSWICNKLWNKQERKTDWSDCWCYYLPTVRARIWGTKRLFRAH